MSQTADPLRTVLVTRPAHQAAPLMTALSLGGYTPVAAPVLQMTALEAEIPAGPFDAAAFTSANAVAAFAALDARRALTVFAVGEATAAAARRAQFQRIVTGYDGAAALADLIRAQMPSGARLLYPSARDVAFDLPGALAAHGIDAARVIVYRMDPADALPGPALCAIETGCIALFHSARSLAAFTALAAASGASLARVVAVRLGGEGDAAASGGFARMVVVPGPLDDAQLLEALERLEADVPDL